MTARFDFRHTFLRRHIAAELGRTDEVLALQELNRIAGAPPLTLLDFFYGGLPDDRLLYIPVRLMPQADDLRGLADRYLRDRPPDAPGRTFDLSHALAALRHCDISGGIYLRSRSGAGKTVAGLAAMSDCFHGAGPEAPRLAGFLPCRLRPGGVFKKLGDQLAKVPLADRPGWLDEQTRVAGGGLVERMLLATAGLAGKGRAPRLRDWLRAGPPLLIFVDLNAFGELERRLTAAALVRFQEETAPAGCRVVVTYRSATLDGVHTALNGCRLLHRFDLEPLTPWQAAEYLRAYRRLAAGRAGTAMSEVALDEEAAALRRFIDDHVTGEESLVSTPLLMHLVTLISGAELREGRVRTLSDLYDRVVHRFFERDFRRTLASEAPRLFAEGAAGGAEGNFNAAMCRVALAILAGGESNTRLTGDGPTTAADVLNQLWEHPVAPRLWSGGPRWHPAAEWWSQDGPYYGAKAVAFDEVHRRELLRRTLLHEDGGGFRFLHDSFIYYFAAVAVRGWRHACWNNGLNDIEDGAHPWYEQTASRLHESPRAWSAAAEFLGGMLQPREMSELAFRMIIAAPKDGWPTALIRLLDGRRRTGPDDAAAAAIDYALHHKEGMVERLPAALRTEVFHYLRDGAGDAACREYAGRLEKAGGCAWMCSVKPTWWPAPVMRVHRDMVTCVALMPDGCVVSGSNDGRVVLWDPGRRRLQILITHGDWVWAVAVSGDGDAVVSGCKDGSVRRWTRHGGAEAEPIVRHGEWVLTVAVSGDGHTVVSGDARGAVRRWTRQDGENREPILTHEGRAKAVAVSGDGGDVVSGGEDGLVRRWTRQGGADAGPILTHGGQVWAVAVSDGGDVVSGGEDGSVRRWTRHGGADAEPILTHQHKVRTVAVSGDGDVVVSGDAHGSVRRWTRQGGADAEPILTHQFEVRAVAVSGDGDAVVSGGDDRAVRRWTRQGGAEAGPILTHEGWVLAVAVSGDGGAVVSGDAHGSVRRWTRQGGADAGPILTHEGEVRAVAVSGDGGAVVSGGEDGSVRRWTRHGGADAGPILTHAGRVWAVAVSADGGAVVTGGGDGWVRRWTREGGAEAGPILRHQFGVRAVALSDDGDAAASGGGDGSVRRWTRQGGAEAEPILRHRGVVLAVAVSGDGDAVVSGSAYGSVRRWTRRGGAEAEPITRHGADVRAVAVSGDGDAVVSCGAYGSVWRWTRQSGARAVPLLPHGVFVREAALSADGGTAVAGGEDWPIQCYRQGQGVVCVFLFNSGVRCLALADAVGRIAAGLANGEVPILDLRNFPPDRPA